MYKRDFVAAQSKNLKDIKTEISVRAREVKFTLWSLFNTETPQIQVCYTQ